MTHLTLFDTFDTFGTFDTFDTSKPGKFNSLRGHFYYETVTSKLIEGESQCQNKVMWLFFISFR